MTFVDQYFDIMLRIFIAIMRFQNESFKKLISVKL